jgi:hypothetical protein
VELRGMELNRIEKISSDDATWTLAPEPKDAEDADTREATVKLSSKAKKGEHIAAEVYVADLQKPLRISDLLAVAGPRPKIVSVSKSLVTEEDVALHDGEVPAGQGASFALNVQNAGNRPTVKLSCNSEVETRQKISLAVGDKSGPAQLDRTGQNTLFLSVDPGVVGDSGCALVAQVSANDTGDSDPYDFGQVIRLPRIEKLTVSEQRLGNDTYAGTLTGENLQLIAKAGWNDKSGSDVQEIPSAVPGNPQEQTLKIAVPWPPPSPQAPLYVWLRGEDHARLTTARY